ncbi:MAG: hypothetical protein P8P90_07045 [Opitutales bacterium]|nr:hypothetical protein [Opitutales bacterium]
MPFQVHTDGTSVTTPIFWSWKDQRCWCMKVWRYEGMKVGRWESGTERSAISMSNFQRSTPTSLSVFHHPKRGVRDFPLPPVLLKAPSIRHLHRWIYYLPLCA